MKIRNDFVTNSSSSSFVISRKNAELNSVDSLYKYIRNLYIIYRDNIKDIITYVMNDNRILIKMDKETGLPHYITHNEQYLKACSSEYEKLDKKLKSKFNLSFFDTLDFDTTWVSCKTYEEYEEYFKGQGITYGGKPFEIYDFSKTDKSEDEIDTMSEVVAWYFYCFNNDDEDNCKWCSRKNTPECERVKKLKGRQTCSPDFFGNICLYSESGYMPEFITEAVSKKCDYYCGHMG